MLPSSSLSSLSPPPPLLTTIAIQTGPPPAHDQNRRGGGMSPTVLIITGIAALVFILSASIRLLLRHLARRRRSRRLLPSSRSSSPSLSDTTASSSFNPTAIDQKALIDSLPLFTLASSVAALPKSSPDCAVCLSRFDPDEQLRLLPACRHAFHSACIDAWLRSTPSCPLCRATVVALPAPADEADGPKPNPSADPDRAGSGRSGSFRLEIGSVSRRRDDAPPPSSGTPPQQHARTYSLGSSFDYVVEEEIEAVVAAVAAHVRRNSQPPPAKDAAAPGDSVAEVAGGSGRSWLKDYVDRLASSASSSFSSLRFSGRWSRRSDAGAAASAVGSWDLEGSYPSSGQQGGVTEEEMAPIYSFYRWLIGV